MNFQFATQINPFLEKLDFDQAIKIGEAELNKLPLSDFHSIIGKSFIHHSENLALWIDNFFKINSTRSEIKALYFEMNEFDINTQEWYIDGFAYSKNNGLNLEDMEWLCEFEFNTKSEFTIDGLDVLQSAFENLNNIDKNLKDSADWCEQLIICRYMELISTTHTLAKTNNKSWGQIPIYCTEHEYDFIIQS